MSDWENLDISTEGVDQGELHRLICQAVASKVGDCLWIAEVDLDVRYTVFGSMQEMCENIWYEWPSDELDNFIEEYKVAEEVPVILAEHARQYYVLKTKELAQEFLSKSVDVVRNNPTEEEF